MRDGLSVAARIAGNVASGGLRLSPLFSGLFLLLARILRNLEKRFHAFFKALAGLRAFVVFIRFGHIKPLLKWRAMYALIALLLFVYQANPQISPEKTSVHERNTQTETQQTGNDKQNPPATSIGECVNCFDVQEPRAQQQQHAPYDAGHDTLYRAYLLVAIIGVFFALIALITLICQTIATRKAAGAASDNAKALINSERAWILVDLTQCRFEPNPDEMGVFWIRPIVKNSGKTIARIKYIRAIVKLLADGESLPPEPQYPLGQGADIPGITAMLPPNEPIKPIKLAITSEELSLVHRFERFLYVHGFVVYLDFSGQERRSNFCYYYAEQRELSPDPSAFYLHLIAPPPYNECT